jgi:hypothetical protein
MQNPIEIYYSFDSMVVLGLRHQTVSILRLAVAAQPRNAYPGKENLPPFPLLQFFYENEWSIRVKEMDV